MPNFSLYPSCDLTSEDIAYSLVVGSELPAWVTFDEVTRIVTIDTNASDEYLAQTSSTLQFLAKFDQLEKSIKFEVSFSMPKIDENIDEVTANNEEAPSSEIDTETAATAEEQEASAKAQVTRESIPKELTL